MPVSVRDSNRLRDLFSLLLWVVYSVTMEDFFHFQATYWLTDKLHAFHLQVVSEKCLSQGLRASQPCQMSAVLSIYQKHRTSPCLVFYPHSSADLMALVLPYWQTLCSSHLLPVAYLLHYQLQFAEVTLWKLRNFLWRIPKHRFKDKKKV